MEHWSRLSAAIHPPSEAKAGLDTLAGHAGFAAQVAAVRNDLIEFLVACSREGAVVAGYGAPGKGNTLLNHVGVRSDLLAFTVDRNPVKHGKFLPGTHIPIHPGQTPAALLGRGPRRDEYTICTAVAPDAVFTVRTYATTPQPKDAG
jgi:hypothetical protein